MAEPSPPTDRPEQAQNIATAIAEVSERASILIREEIELAKAEMSQKVTKLVKGVVVAGAAGIFVVVALLFVLEGLAWLVWYVLPTGQSANYFWGFFVVAAGLLLLGGLAGFVAAKAVKAGAPPTPKMAIEEARKIRETVGNPSGEGS